MLRIRWRASASPSSAFPASFGTGAATGSSAGASTGAAGGATGAFPGTTAHTVAVAAHTASTAAADFSSVAVMDFIAPCASWRTNGETRTSADRPAANAVAARAVAPTKAPDATGRATAPRATPRRDNRFASKSLARDSWPAMVPTGSPVRRAASACVSPSQKHSRIGTRYRSGSRATSSQSGPASAASGRPGAATSAISALMGRRPRCRASRTDTRWAIRYSHPTTDPRPVNDFAFRARTRNVACAASSAAWWSRRTARHTR